MSAAAPEGSPASANVRNSAGSTPLPPPPACTTPPQYNHASSPQLLQASHGQPVRRIKGKMKSSRTAPKKQQTPAHQAHRSPSYGVSPAVAKGAEEKSADLNSVFELRSPAGPMTSVHVLSHLKPFLRRRQHIALSRNPNIKRWQQKHAHDERCNQPSHNHNRKRPLRIRSNRMRQGRRQQS